MGLEFGGKELPGCWLTCWPSFYTAFTCDVRVIRTLYSRTFSSVTVGPSRGTMCAECRRRRTAFPLSRGPRPHRPHSMSVRNDYSSTKIPLRFSAFLVPPCLDSFAPSWATVDVAASKIATVCPFNASHPTKALPAGRHDRSVCGSVAFAPYRDIIEGNVLFQHHFSDPRRLQFALRNIGYDGIECTVFERCATRCHSRWPRGVVGLRRCCATQVQR